MSAVKINLNTDNGEHIWLVKSGDRVTGPFTTEELKTKIRSKEVVVIDEISSPVSRWRYVRDEPTFGAVVEEIRRGLLHAQENTEVQGYTGRNEGTQTQTLTHTNTRDEQPEVEIVVEIAADPIIHAEAGHADFENAKNAEFVELGNRGGRTEDARAAFRQFGVGDNAEVKKNVSRFSTVMWISVFAVLAGVAYFVLQTKGSQFGGSDSSVGFASLLERADQDWMEGDFDSALIAYKEANSRKPNQPAIVSRLAALMISKGGTVEAKRLLASAAEKAIEPSSRFDVEMVQGLASLASDELSEAQAKFRMAKNDAEAGDQWKASFNAGVVAFMLQAWDEAVGHFRSASATPIARLMLARSLIRSVDTSEAARSLAPLSGPLKEASGLLEALLASQGDYHQEAAIVAATLENAIGHKERARARLQAAFETDPDQTLMHVHDPFLALTTVRWRAFIPMCQRLQRELPSGFSSAMLSLCMYRAGERDKATQFLDSEIVREPSDHSLQAMKAFFLIDTGRDEDARGALRLAERGEGSRLARILSARVCTHSHDRACAERTWKALSEESGPPIAAFIELASLKVSDNDIGGASPLITRALQISPHYAPALRLKREAGIP
jgi:tetratricopeptide (TPR) repeat protein